MTREEAYAELAREVSTEQKGEFTHHIRWLVDWWTSVAINERCARREAEAKVRELEGIIKGMVAIVHRGTTKRKKGKP